ncbi:protein Smaug homolog 2 isoform X2 [Pituophis catenifer annectens]|uniref:protein Smaug homolog 2 isoform X2 n=1 Tax=Pituophis catenifer annectens TaxID=94852 RepID=UPI0039922995
MMFRDQVGILAGWFKGWNECEQTVALLSLLKRISRTQARFLQLCLEHSLADCTEIHVLESEANSAALPCQIHPSPLKRSMSLIPSGQQVTSEWMNVDEMGARPAFISSGEHAPLSPQSSVASSGSEQTEEQPGSRNTFQEDGSGMKDVPSWLKSLRLHKYAALFSQMTYEEMMTLTEQHLESQNVTKGARHKIALSIQKLRERQSVLKSLEKDILEGGNLWNALQELQQIITTPIKAFHTLHAVAASKEAQPLAAEPRGGPTLGLEKSNEDKEAPEDHFPPPTGSPCDGESGAAPIAEGDIAGQFTRVMGKVCTQLLVSRPDEENITSYLQLIEKCLMHEAFTETQKKRLLSWKQQVLKLLRTFPRKAVLDMQGYRPQKGWAFGSNSLPIAGSVGVGVARRGQRQFQMPPRAIPPSRMGILSPVGIGGVSPRHGLTSPNLGSQGRQNLWFANPGGSNSMPGQNRSSVQRTHSLPVHTSPQAILMFPQDCQLPGTDLEINPTLESLCLSMTEHALGDGTDKTSTI